MKISSTQYALTVIPFGMLVAAGGAMGYMKKGSVMSLISGITFCASQVRPKNENFVLVLTTTNKLKFQTGSTSGSIKKKGREWKEIRYGDQNIIGDHRVARALHVKTIRVVKKVHASWTRIPNVDFGRCVSLSIKIEAQSVIKCK